VDKETLISVVTESSENNRTVDECTLRSGLATAGRVP
jgi:hypothetical protein